MHGDISDEDYGTHDRSGNKYTGSQQRIKTYIKQQDSLGFYSFKTKLPMSAPDAASPEENAAIEANTSGTPLPNARNVTP